MNKKYTVSQNKDGDWCVYEDGEEIKSFGSDKAAAEDYANEKRGKGDDEDDAKGDEEMSAGNFLFVELSDSMADEVAVMDGLAAGTFTSNSGREVSFPPTDLPTYVANTRRIIASTRTDKGEIVGLPIDMDAHDHRGGAGWIVGAEHDKARDVVRFMVKWTEEGKKLIKGNIRRFFSPSTDITNKAVLGGSLTNWPASRSPSGQIMLRPVELSQQLKSVNMEALIEKLVAVELEKNPELSKQGVNKMGDTNVNPTLTQLLNTPAAVEELGRQAQARAEELVAADRRKREVVEFASTLVGGTKEKPFGLPVRAEDVVTVLLSLPIPQAKAVEKLLTMALNAAIDFAEHGYSYANDGALLQSGKPHLPAALKPYVTQWLASGQNLAAFFAANPELGAMVDYNLAEFSEQAKV